MQSFKSLLESTNNTRWVIKNKYIRSDLPNKLTKRDLKWLHDNNVKLIIDLRNIREIYARQQEATPEYRQLKSEFIWINAPIKGFLKHQTEVNSMRRCYNMMIDSDFVATINLIKKYTNNGHTVFFHCHGGKDRTGSVAAALQLLEDEPYEKIVEDYLKTNKIKKFKEPDKPIPEYIMEAVTEFIRVKKTPEIEATTDCPYIANIICELMQLTGRTYEELKDIVDIEYWSAIKAPITPTELANTYHIPILHKTNQIPATKTEKLDILNDLINNYATIDYRTDYINSQSDKKTSKEKK